VPPKKKAARPRPIHFETTIPVIRQCRACGVWLAAGRAEGVRAEIELGIMLDFGQRLWCALNQIQMYALRRSGLVQMDAGRLGDPKFETLFPQHHCHVRWPQPELPPVRRIPVNTSIPF
jgi:hypothetical protein